MTYINFQPLRAYSVVALLFFSGFMASTASAEGAQAAPSSLDPQKRTQVREVGHALLMANRTFQGDADADAIHQQVQQVRQAINALTQPLPTQTLTLATERSQGRTLQKARDPQASSAQWQQARRQQITQLNNSLTVLQQRCDDFRAKHQKPTPGFFQRLSAWALGTPEVNKTTHPVITDASEVALSRLETLQDEVNAALEANPEDRHQQLTALAERLNFTKQSVMLPESAKKETPTYLTRTTHR